MILNTLHAITLALSVGLTCNKPNIKHNKEKQPYNAQDVTRTDWNLYEWINNDNFQTQTETIQVNAIVTTGYYWHIQIEYQYQTFSMNNSFVSITGLWIREIPKSPRLQMIDPNQYDTWIGQDTNKIGHISSATIYAYEDFYQTGLTYPVVVPAVTQEMIIYKIQPTGNNINNYTKPIQYWDIDNANSTDFGYYTKRFSTRWQGMANYIPIGQNVNLSMYIKNNNLYDKFIEIITQSGYSSYVKDEWQSYSEETDWLTETQIIMNSTNYYIQYIEPKHIVQTQTTDAYKTHVVFSENEDNTFQIYGTNVVVSSNQEVVDIPGVMFTILGMPFTFISTAFNLTLFPGTPYEINISLLFLSIFAVIVFIFLIKFILSKVGK